MKDLKIAGLFAGSAVLAACATPALEYDARLPAGDLAASSYRNVAVDDFRGPEGGWFTARFEQMLVDAALDGERWFRVSVPSGAAGAYSGIYAGRVEIESVDVYDYREKDTKCVEWDGLFDCETRIDIEKICYETTVEVSVTPRLIDTSNGEVVYSRTHYGSAENTECFEDRVIGEDRKAHRLKGPRPSHAYFGYSDQGLTPELVREALSDTFAPIRADIAPVNARVKAPLVVEALDPEAGADPDFAFAVNAAKNGDLTGSCALWDSLHQRYPGAPGVSHNLGACAEASGDYARAQVLYASAVEAGQAGWSASKGVEQLTKSLQRISGRRQGETIIEAMTAPAPDEDLPAEQQDE